MNPRTEEIYDTRRVEAFQDGVYLRYEVKGAVRFRVSQAAGANAVISAVLVDE